MTSNSIKAQELQETKRANQEKERQGREDLNRKEREYKYKKIAAENKSVNDGTNTMLKGLEGAGKIITAAGMNDRSFYDKLDPSLSNELKVSTSTYAGLPQALNNDDLIETSDLMFAPGWVGAAPRTCTVQKAAIFCYNFTPYIGDGDGTDNPCSNAIRLFNSKVRAANAGPATNYDSVDLFMIPLATDSFVYMQGWVERGIEIAKTVDNRDLSTQMGGLLTAHCYGNTALAQTFIDMSALIIAAANKARANYNALNIPYEFDYVKRHLFLTGNVFKDGDGIHANYHIMNPDGYYVYDELNSSLNFVDVRQTLRNVGYGQVAVGILANMFAAMLNPLLDSQTVATMSGDMLKAYGDMKTTMPYMPIEDVAFTTNYKMNFVTDVKYLQSFKNASIRNIYGSRTISQVTVNNETRLVIGQVSGTNWLGLEVDTDGIEVPNSDSLTESSTTDVEVVYNDETSNYIDYYDNVISEEDQLYNLSFYNGMNGRYVRDARSEIITKFTCCLFSINNGLVTPVATNFQYTSNFQLLTPELAASTLTGIYSSIIDGLVNCNTLDQFNFIPKFIFGVITVGTNGNPIIRGLLSWNRNHNRRFCDPNTLGRIQTLALISMFLPGKSSSRAKDGKRSRRR